MASHNTTKKKARLLYQALIQIEADYFSDKPKFGVSKDDILPVIKLAGAIAHISDEYNRLIDAHKKLFFKDAGFTSKAVAQLTEDDNRLLSNNMTTYLSIDEKAQLDIEKFNSSNFSINTDLLLTGLSDAILPHEIRNAIKEFING